MCHNTIGFDPFEIQSLPDRNSSTLYIGGCGWCSSSCLLAAGHDFHLFPGGVGSWLQMQASNPDSNGVVGGGGSSPLEVDDDDEMVELRHRDGCIQFY